MRLDTLLLDRGRGSAASLALLAFFFGGCATAQNPALDRARNAYERARQDPGVAGRAAVALDKTRLTLEKAERLWATEKDVAEVEHLVYLTEKRAEIARATAKRRLAADEIQQLMPKRE
jgi:OmpA-OmpF porin, OOP family